MFKVKWINYAAKILKAIESGTGNIKAIASDCDIPEAYAAKIIATLRKHKVISSNYELLVHPITVEGLLRIGHDFDRHDKSPAARLRDYILFHTRGITVDEIW